MTGGQALFPVSVKELDSVYDKIRSEIAARYSLGYMSIGRAHQRRVAQRRDPAEAAPI